MEHGTQPSAAATPRGQPCDPADYIQRNWLYELVYDPENSNFGFKDVSQVRPTGRCPSGQVQAITHVL